jgi:hypothetical protein
MHSTNLCLGGNLPPPGLLPRVRGQRWLGKGAVRHTRRPGEADNHPQNPPSTCSYAPNTTAPPAKGKPGRQASVRRRAKDRRRREAWAGRRRPRSQSRLRTPSIAKAVSATAESVVSRLSLLLYPQPKIRSRLRNWPKIRSRQKICSRLRRLCCSVNCRSQSHHPRCRYRHCWRHHCSRHHRSGRPLHRNGQKH